MSKVIGMLILVMLIGIAGTIETTYTSDVTVVETDEDVAVIEIYNGHRYEIETTEQLNVGDEYTVLMNNNGTDTVFTDDRVITIY